MWKGCPFDVAQNNNCINDKSWRNSVPSFFSASMAVSTLSANVVYSRRNSSILSIANQSQPITEIISPSDFFDVFDLVFSSPSTSAGVLTSAGLLTVYIYDYLNLAAETVTGVGAQKYLRTFLTLPLYFSHANNFNPDVKNSSVQRIENLPNQLYVDAILSQSQVRAVVAPWTAYVFSGISALLVLWCIVALIWSMTIQIPHITAFPLLDFASKVVVSDSFIVRCIGSTVGYNGIGVRNKLNNVRLFLRELALPEVSNKCEGSQLNADDLQRNRETVFGFSDKHDGGQKLRKGMQISSSDE